MKYNSNKTSFAEIIQTKKIARSRIVVILCLIVGGHLCISEAAEWHVVPSIEARVSYTDNVGIDNINAAESDIISELLPSLIIDGQGVNTKIAFNYQMQHINYKNNSEQNTEFHQLDLNINQNLVGGYLFMDVAGIYEQQIVDNQTAVPASNIFISANRTNTTSYQVSPYLHKSYAGNTQLTIRPSYGKVRYEDLQQFNNTIKQGVAILEHTQTQNSLGWRVSAQQQGINYENEDEVALKRIDYGILAPISMRSIWFVSGGNESNEYTLQQNTVSIDDKLWSTGIRWEPQQRTHLLLGFGERFFGRTYDLEFRHRTHFSHWSLEYHENLETESLQLQPLLSAQQTSESYRQPMSLGLSSLSNEIYVVNRLVGGLRWNRSKSTLDINITNESRDYQISEREERLITGSIGYTLSMSSKTNINFTVNHENRRIADQDREDKTQSYSVSLNNNLTRSLAAQLQYNSSKIDSNQDNFDRQYSLVRVSIKATF